MTKTIPTYRRREYLQLPTDEYGDDVLKTTSADDDNNFNENYGLLQMRDEFVASLMDDDTDSTNNNNYQPYPQQQHTKHHHHNHHKLYNTDFVVPQNGGE
uniref:Uncharacterized protein n=1 Tax=Globodera rostochiensis TaxID=31243 RepID=A0A914H025_GLORO